MKTQVGKFKFTVPSDAVTPDGQPHPEAGKKLEKPYEYSQVETDDEANAILAKKEMTLQDIVNERLKENAKSSAYQSTLLLYKPSKVSEDDIVERMVRDYIRLGASEELARAQVKAVLAASKSEG